MDIEYWGYAAALMQTARNGEQLDSEGIRKEKCFADWSIKARALFISYHDIKNHYRAGPIIKIFVFLKEGNSQLQLPIMSGNFNFSRFIGSERGFR